MVEVQISNNNTISGTTQQKLPDPITTIITMQPAKIIITVLSMATAVAAGPIAYAACQAGCAAVVTACYSGAGFAFGTVLAASAPAAVVSCNSAFGYCQAQCALVTLLPTP